MAGILSKRQQARNEAVLQDLVHNVPGNNACADCLARNPSWASWSLGVFLCMRCAAIHRKLGTHISKVKSLSMDAWTNEQVDNMRKVGNVVSNKNYNSDNKKPAIPVDADEVDSAMERFIRQKYIINTGAQSGKKKQPFLDEGTPPPLPPKNSKFGFRSTSSIFPLSSKSRKETKLAAHDSYAPTNAQPKAFSATDNFGDDDREMKLARLRDMGFSDDHRNDMILTGVNGNLERAVEALIRLGEGDRSSPAPGAASTYRTLRTSRSLTPVNPNSARFGGSLGLSATFAAQDRPTSATTPSTNLFDMGRPAPPQSAFSTGTIQNNNPYLSSTSPFGLSPQPTGPANSTFQNLSLPQTQPLFPHHTGGGTSQPSQFARFPSPTSSTPSFSQPYHGNGFQNNMTHTQPGSQPLMPQQTGYNPFFTQQQAQAPVLQPQTQQGMPSIIAQGQAQAQTQVQMPMQMPMQSTYANNPFARTPTRIASPPLTQIPEQSQPPVFQMPQQLQPQHTSTNPFFSHVMQQPLQTTPQTSEQQQFWQPKRQDKASILALFNQPPPQQYAQPLGSTSIPGPAGQAFAGSEGIMSAMQTMEASGPAQQGRSTSQLIPTSSTNPFMKNGAAAGAGDVFTTDRKTSRESVSLGMDMAWTNGRHSPDAFASLSARHV